MLGLEILLGEFYFRNSFKRNPIYQKCIHQLRQYFHSNLLSFFLSKNDHSISFYLEENQILWKFMFFDKRTTSDEDTFYQTIDKVRIFWEGHRIWKNLPLKIRRYPVTFSEYPNFNKSTPAKENHGALQFYLVYKKSILRYSDTVGNRRGGLSKQWIKRVNKSDIQNYCKLMLITQFHAMICFIDAPKRCV